MTYEEFTKLTKEEFEFKQEAQATVERVHKKTVDMFQKRVDNARAVIDKIAEYLGLGDSGLYLYQLDEDGTTPLLTKIDNYFDRGGDKVKLKKRIDELEKENAILRSVLHSGGKQ